GRLALQRPQHPDVGELAVAGEVVAGLGLDGGGPGEDPLAEPFADAVAERPGVGAPGDGDGGVDAASRRGDRGVGRAAGAHRELGPAVARVDGGGVRVDEPGRDEAAAEVLDVVDVDDVVDDAGDALREGGGGPRPDDAVVVDEDGGVAADVGARPEPADVRQQPYG